MLPLCLSLTYRSTKRWYHRQGCVQPTILHQMSLRYYLQQNDADTPEWLHPVIKSVSYWQNHNNPEQQRIYVNTDVGSLFYNLPSGFLCGKDCDATHVYREEFDANVLEFIGVNTMKDLLAFRGKKYN